jgi:receptor protein-tyrosine kinase
VIGVAVGWLSAPGTPAKATTFEATQTLIVDPVARSGGFVNRATVIARLGAVPDRVADRLNLNPEVLGSMVSAVSQDRVGVVAITGRSSDPAQAEALARVTGEELIVELGGPQAPIRPLEPAVATPVDSGDVEGPRSRGGRALLVGGFGLLLGSVAAFAVERFDTRLRSQRAAEDALGLPVIAEVPPISRRDRGRLLTGTEAPSVVEAYRSLRSALVRWKPTSGPDSGRRVMVVSSPGDGEGKTTTAAHLAMALAESGHSVLVISGDLRRPDLHRYFDRAHAPGLTDVLTAESAAGTLAGLDLATGIPRVNFVASGSPVDNPAPLLERVGDLLRAAGNQTDFVVVDSPALLGTADAGHLARHADGMLLVVRSGRTSTRAALRSVELVQRLGVPIIGTVLVGSNGT